MKPRYFHEFLRARVSPPKDDRSRERGLKGPCDLEKWNTSVFECSTMSPNLSKRLVIEISNNLFWETKSPSSTKEMIDTGILRLFRCFSKIYKKGER